MKESTLATKVMVIVLCIGVAAYIILSFFRGFQDELVTTVAYAYSVDVGAEAAGVVVREELVLGDTGPYVDLVLAEGEKAAAGSAVALLYEHPSALDTRQEIRALTAEIQQLEYALSTGTQSADSSRLDSQVVASIVNLRALSASGDLSALEDSVLNLRTMVFRRDYAYGDTEAASRISQLIRDRQDRLAALNQSLNQVSRTVYAPRTGVFSGEPDGYEGLITPAMLDTLTPDELSALISRAAPARPDSVGKLITDSTWYLAALFPGENSYGLAEGRTYSISFYHDYYGSVPMRLERIVTGPESTMVIFSARSHLADTTLLRVQTVDIVTRQIQGIRIPRKALRVSTREVTGEDGTVRTENVYGIYTVVGAQAEWQEVRVLYTDESFYLVEPVDENAVNKLRPGDEVILSTAGIYNGKVVR